MKARIMNRTVEIPDERMGRGGVEPSTALSVRDCKAGSSAGRRRQTVDAEHTQAGEKMHASTLAPSPLPGWPKPTDKWNYAYAQYLELEKQAGRVKYWWYEPWSMWLPGGVRFKPDFLIQYPDGLERRLHVVEIKGGWSRNRRDGVTRYKIAAALFPCFDWSMVKRKGHGWEEYGA